MNISVNNLDLGYNQTSDLNSLSVTSGQNLITKLEGNINNLKVNWVGNDATTHINNLIKVYDALVSIVSGAKAVTSAAGSAMISVQKVRNANGGTGQIGSELDGSAAQSTTISQCQETNEYYCTPSAKGDYEVLVQICNEFNTFKDEFVNQKDTLLSNWTSGANREQAVTCFNNFVDNAETYYGYLTSAKNNLETAVSNISQLQQ